MKKTLFFAIIVMVALSFSACNEKPKTTPEKLIFIWDKLQGGGRNIPLENCVMYVNTNINFNYSTRGFEVVSVQITDGDSTTYQFTIENTPYHGWLSEKDIERSSKNGEENLRPINKHEEKFIRIAYHSIMNDK